MSELKVDSVAFLTDLIKLVNSARIGSVIIDDLGVRAIDETGTIAFMGTDVPEFPGNMGLTRVPQLKARLDLFQGKSDFKVEYTMNEEKGFVKALKFISNGIKADYRTGDPENIRAPKRILDEDATGFTLSSETVSEIQSAVGAFGPAKDIQFAVRDGNVLINIQDENGDGFSKILGTAEVDNLAHTYDALNVSNLMKLCISGGNVEIAIGQKGILTIKRASFNFYVMPSKRG